MKKWILICCIILFSTTAQAKRMHGHDLDKAKSEKRLMYWISFQLPIGKQKQEGVG